MRFLADNSNGNYEIEFELTERESENLDVMIENFVNGMSLIMVKAINKALGTREKAKVFSMLTMKSLNGVMKTFIERRFDDERLKQEREACDAMVSLYEEWLKDIVTVTEDELLEAYADSENLEIECMLKNDTVQIFITNGERSNLLTEFQVEEVKKHPDHVELYCILALAILIVFSDKIFLEYENPVRDRDNDPKKLVYAVNKLLGEQAL